MNLNDGALLREQSRPEVYVMYSGKKIWVPTTDAFRAMGLSWDNVQVVPDGSLASLPTAEIESASPTPESLVFPPPSPKWLPRTDLAGTTRIVSQGVEVRLIELRGWILNVSSDCNASDPDWDYSLEIDPSWVDALGLDPGHLIKVGDILNGIHDDTGSLYRSVSIPLVNIELCGWPAVHWPNAILPGDWQFRGANACPEVTWPFSPLNPVPGNPPLQDGQYVRILGSFVTDAPHAASAWFLTWLSRQFNININDAELNAVKQAWGGDEYDPRHPARYTEVHPPDKIEVLPPKAPTETLKGVALLARNGLFFGDTERIDIDIFPPVPREIFGQLSLRVDPASCPLGTPVQVTVHAEDTQTQAPLTGTVLIDGRMVGTTNTPFPYTFRTYRRRQRNPDGTWEYVTAYPTGTVTIPGPALPRPRVQESVGPDTNLGTIIEGNASRTGAVATVLDDRVHVHVAVQGQGGWGAPGKFVGIYRVSWDSPPPLRYPDTRVPFSFPSDGSAP